jgi:ferric-dicitrate binding protein FerR (iron transport regulator)
MSEFGYGSASEQAARWFARRRRGVIAVEEKTEYEAWRADPRNAAAMDELERTWALMDLVGNHFSPGTATASARPPAFTRSALFALMCVVSLGVGILTYSGHSAFWTKLDWVER